MDMHRPGGMPLIFLLYIRSVIARPCRCVVAIGRGGLASSAAAPKVRLFRELSNWRSIWETKFPTSLIPSTGAIELK